MDDLGRAIFNARKSKRWTQQELAEYVSAEIGREPAYNQTVISRIETSDTTIDDQVLRVLVKWGIGMNLTEARRLNSVRVRDKNPRERLAEVEYEVKMLRGEIRELLDAVKNAP